jgi:hypothetical protein
MKLREQNFEIRDKYLTAVIRDPRQEERVLEFVVATAEDDKIKGWAKKQLEKATKKVARLDVTAVERKQLYLKTIGVVAQLADAAISQSEWEKQRKQFWHLYRSDLLPVESPEVESLMVRIGRDLNKCGPGQCKAIEGLTYQLARQMKAEIAADSSAMATGETSQKPEDSVAQDNHIRPN